MGDRKQQGDSEYGDSEYDPRALDFLRREDFLDDPGEVTEEPRTLVTSSAAAKASCTVAEALAHWTSSSLGDTPDTTGFVKAASKALGPRGPAPPYPAPNFRGRPVLPGRELPPVPVFDTTTRQVDRELHAHLVSS